MAKLFSTLCCCLILLISSSCCSVYGGIDFGAVTKSVVKREERTVIADTEYGEVSAVDVGSALRGAYHLQFITLEPNALFLPVLLHADMVLYVRTGSGRLTWVGVDDSQRVDLKCGDIYRLTPGTMFHVQSDLEDRREKLRIYAFFTNTEDDHYDPLVGAYSSVGDLLRGFDRRVLQEAFNAPEDVVDEIMSASRPPAIIHAASESKARMFFEQESRMLKSYLTGAGIVGYNKKKMKVFNVYKAKKDFENCNGWSLTVTRKDDHTLKDTHLGIFMVNLTKGSMMGPHWNPRATEVAIALHGKGMIRVVCSSLAKESGCKDSRFRVEEGDVVMVPRFHPMAQMSYNNESFVFMGFSTTTRRIYPQFLAGRSSVLQALGRHVLAASFNVPNKTVDRLMSSQVDSVILECTSCAEEEERLMEEELEREREAEEAERRKEEERERREEEEERRKRKEEERERREEEEMKRREEEEMKRREEEEERRRKEEEERERREEEEARKREEEEKERREEEEAREREEEEKARRREEEEERAREMGHREEEWRRERAQREEEAARRQEEEMERWQRQGEDEEPRQGRQEIEEQWDTEPRRVHKFAPKV